MLLVFYFDHENNTAESKTILGSKLDGGLDALFFRCLQEESYEQSRQGEKERETEKARESQIMRFSQNDKWRWSCFTCRLLFSLRELRYVQSIFEANSKIKRCGLTSFARFANQYSNFSWLFLCSTPRALSRLLFYATVKRGEKRFAVYLNGRCIDCKTLFHLM